jgi:2-amino-4-hydroxy-6-hydroxymethyldihydropteridine diphosphokinase
VNESRRKETSARRELSRAGINTVIIGLGSNIDPVFHIAEAKKYLARHCSLIKESRFVKTKPVGRCDQADFLNGAVMIQTDDVLPVFKAALKQLERQLGRTRKAANLYGPRTIDLDIIVWNRTIIDQDFYHRDFVRQSVLELLPDLRY